MNVKKLILKNFIRILLTVLCACAIYWIFSNSMQDGAASSSASKDVTQGVQDAIGTIAPSSPIATATGSDFDKLHAFIRKCAHFLEYAMLGALLFWSCLSYTKLKRFWFVPLCVGFLVAVFDEYIQNFSGGRVCSFNDVMIDTAGAASGILFAGLCALIVGAIVRAALRRRKRKRAALMEGGSAR